jgi:hypothetical protein
MFHRYRSVSDEALEVARSVWAMSTDDAVRLAYRPSLPLATVRDEPGLPDYFTSDGKPLACHRARLRFDQGQLFGSLWRRKLEISSACPNCGYGDESPVHVLLDCPAFSSERSVFVREVARFTSLRVYLRDPAHLYAFVLGECGVSVSAAVRTRLLNLTGDFILSVQAIRRF